eukprot:8089560-Alexandrium_andersonii.AAC.1
MDRVNSCRTRRSRHGEQGDALGGVAIGAVATDGYTTEGAPSCPPISTVARTVLLEDFGCVPGGCALLQKACCDSD